MHEETVTTTEGGFHALNLSKTTLAALDRAGYATPSPVQAALIPPALSGRDCLGNAPTGTGKTAAFLLPLIEKLDERDRRVQALVLAPTRELVHQIGREFDRLTLGRRLQAAPIVGGEPMGRQMRMLHHGVQLILATPGRLMDLMERGAVRLDAVTTVVLDEADQMLDIGFRPAVESILQAVPERPQTLLLSATMPRGVRELAHTYLDDPADVRLISEEDATIPAIRQSYLMVDPRRKIDLLFGLLKREEPRRAIIFCRTKLGSDRLGEVLREAGFRAQAMHGDLSQNQRNRTLHAFRSGRLAMLVATDVVGRGIDVPDISHVINYDVPEDPEQYVHRVGRTGRMGKDGAAFTLVMPDQGKLLDQIERAISRQIDADGVEGFDAPPRPVDHRRGPSRRPGGRGFRGGQRGPSGGPRRRRFGSPQRVG